MKILVAYYSLSGNTRDMAERIADYLKADILEIQTVKEYQYDYDMRMSLGKREVESGYMPKIKPINRKIDKYDIVILGFPVWWNSVAPAVKTFISGYDWTDRRVCPFATSEGTLGKSTSELKRLLRGARLARSVNFKFEENVQITSDEVLLRWLAQF